MSPASVAGGTPSPSPPPGYSSHDDEQGGNPEAAGNPAAVALVHVVMNYK